MIDEAQRAALRREAEERAALFQAIGEFIFEFSQLEFTIRHALGAALDLRDDTLFDAVTSPYDFAALCRVTDTVLKEAFKGDEHAASHVEIDKIFRACLAINDDRVRIVHGTWTIEGGARHVQRSTLKAKDYFDKPDDIVAKAHEAADLKNGVVKILIGRPDEWPQVAV